MFRIEYVVKTGNYIFSSEGSVCIEGSLMQVTEKALEMGLFNEELTFAYETMNKHKDTIAEFGINGMFLFSKKAA